MPRGRSVNRPMQREHWNVHSPPTPVALECGPVASQCGHSSVEYGSDGGSNLTVMTTNVDAGAGSGASSGDRSSRRGPARPRLCTGASPGVGSLRARDSARRGARDSNGPKANSKCIPPTCPSRWDLPALLWPYSRNILKSKHSVPPTQSEFLMSVRILRVLVATVSGSVLLLGCSPAEPSPQPSLEVATDPIASSPTPQSTPAALAEATPTPTPEEPSEPPESAESLPLVLADANGDASPVVAQFSVLVEDADGYRGTVDVTWHDVRDVQEPALPMMLDQDCNTDLLLWGVDEDQPLKFQAVRYDLRFTPEQNSAFPWPEDSLVPVSFEVPYLASINGGSVMCAGGHGTAPSVLLEVDPATGQGVATVDAYLSGNVTPNNPNGWPADDRVGDQYEINIPTGDGAACDALTAPGFAFLGSYYGGCRIVREE